MVRCAGKNKPTGEGSTKVNFYSGAMAATERDMDFLLKISNLLRREINRQNKYINVLVAMKKNEKISIKTLKKMEQVCAILAQAKTRNSLNAKVKTAININKNKMPRTKTISFAIRASNQSRSLKLK